MQKVLRLTKHAQLSKIVWQLAARAFQGVRSHRHKYYDPHINTAGRAGRWRPCGMMYRLFSGAGSDLGVPQPNGGDNGRWNESSSASVQDALFLCCCIVVNDLCRPLLLRGHAGLAFSLLAGNPHALGHL